MTSGSGTPMLREARAAYFDANGFGDDGGYSARWVRLQLGPLPFAFPNTAARVRAVERHDLHHVLTGYATDLRGEAEIGAWEIGSGCGRFAAAWILNLHALAIGLLMDAGAMWRAFVRGRCSGNLYHEELGDALLASPVGAVRSRLGIDAPRRRGSARDALAFAAWSSAAIAFTLATAALLLSPLGLLAVALL